MLRHMKLRTRLTIFMAIILFFACSVLALTLTYSADKIYQSQTATASPFGSIIVNNSQANTGKDRSNDTFRIVSLISIVLIFVTGTGVTYATAGKVLGPITKLSHNIETIDENNLFMPVSETKSGDEVSKLSASFNNMISKLEKAFISQKNFSANVAHELKTPLAAMISRIEVCQLDENPSPLEYKDTLDDVLQSAERLGALVSDLLAMNTETFIEKRESIDVKQMFEHIIEDVSQNNPKGVRFNNLANGINIFGDRSLLYRVFLNIVQNAVKYNKPDGSVTISAATNGENTIIAISDTGIGIPMDQLDRIFDPFYCVDKSRSRQLGGSGIGLALVKAIIEKHGGKIHADSELGMHTTITVILPQ